MYNHGINIFTSKHYAGVTLLEHMGLQSIHRSPHASICHPKPIPSLVGKHSYGSLEPHIQHSIRVARLVVFGLRLAGAACTALHFSIA